MKAVALKRVIRFHPYHRPARSPFKYIAGIGIGTLVLLISVFLLFGQQGQTEKRPASAPIFSPNGQFVAWVWEKVSPGMSIGPEPMYKAESTGICFCSVTDVKKVQELELDSAKLSGRTRKYLSRQIHLAFAPDSKHLTVVSGSGLCLINLTTNQNIKRDIGSGLTSLAWLNNRELGYAQEGAIWRQSIQLEQAPQKIFSDKSLGGNIPYYLLSGEEGAWPKEKWSPDGKYAIYLKQEGNHGRFCLLDTGTASAIEFGPKIFSFLTASWKRDGSAALCLGKRGDDYVALTINPTTKEEVNFSDEFTQSFKREFLDPGLSRPGEETPSSLWTADGKFFVANIYKEGGYLVQPQPWLIISLGQQLGKRFSQPPTDTTNNVAGVKDPYPWDFHPSPLPGWLLTSQPGIGTDYLTDYEGRTFTQLLGFNSAWTGVKTGPTISPDGKSFAEVVSSHGLQVSSINMSSSRPIESVTSAPAPQQ